MWIPLALALVQWGGSGDLQPATYPSPSGEWELFVDPSDRRGLGPSNVRFRRGEKEVWAGELPFTFERAVIDEAGTAAGCGYSGTPPYAPDREFFVAIVRPDGEVVLEERHEMRPSRFMHTSADPKLAGVLLQPELGRFVVRVQDPDVNRQNESWWLFDLGSGAPGDRVHVRDGFDDAEELRSCIAAAALPGTPLTLAQWRFGSRGARFVLLDAGLRPVWSLDLPTDYEFEDDRDREQALLRRIREGEAMVVLEERRFELWFVQAGQRVTFSVDPGGEDDWQVAEVGRRPCPLGPDESSSEETATGAADAQAQELPRFELRPLGVARLDAGMDDTSPVRDVVAFDVSAHGAIRFVRRESEGLVEVRLDPAGELLEEIALPVPPAPGTGIWAPLPDGDWIQASSWWGDELVIELARVSADRGSYASIELPEEESIEAAAVSVDRLAILQGDRLHLFDRQGRSAWPAVSAAISAELFSPEDLAIGADARLAVVDNIRDTIQIFSAAGELERRIELETALPSPPSYPVGLEPDLQGGWILHDFHGDPPIWRLSSDGLPLVGLEPRFQDGSTSDVLSRELRREADGHLWTTDRASLLRLTEDGVVDRVVGLGPSPERLTDPGTAQVDHLGRILVQDRRTGAIHLFDRSGARLAVAELEREEVERVGWFPHAFVRDDGSFLFQLGRGTDYADFGPDAARVGRVELPLTGMTPQPGRGTAWGRASEGIQRIELGGAVLRTIRRHEDGTWISGGSLAVASDGSLVLHSRVDGEDAQRVSWYDPEGELEGTLMLPPGVGGRSLIAGHGWVALTGFGPELFLVDLETRAVGRAAVAEDEGPSWWFGASPDGRELWAIEIAGGLQPPVLRRFTVPGFD